MGKSNLTERLVASWQIIVAFTFGVVFVVALLILAIVFPTPTPFLYTVIRIILALAAAGVAAMIPGAINVNIHNVVVAGGAAAVFVITYFFSPAQLITELPPLPFLITTPVNGANVELTETIRGETPHNQMNHYILVTPSTGENWVQQNSATVSAGGSWTGFAKFGEATVGAGEQFIVRCVATKSTLTSGRLDQMPSDAIFSESITVIRK